jgi:CubicO group peptidase (beta-lactamase class C family)
VRPSRSSWPQIATGLLTVFLAAVPLVPAARAQETANLFDPQREQGLGALLDDGAADDPSAVVADGREISALRARIAEILARSGVPGIAVAVVTPAGSWTEGFGRASADRRMDAETLFRGGSLTKPFLVLAVLRLVEKGKLRLEDKVRDLVPEIAVSNPWERTHPLRVEHLLSHTAGFDEMRFNEIFAPPGAEDWPLSRVLAVNTRSRVARWRPGTRFSYSQPGYTLAAAIMEKVTGLPYEQILETEVFRPLGITGATLRLDAAARARLAVGHHGRNAAPTVMLLHRPAGNLMMSATAMARLIAVQLRRGVASDGSRFLPAAAIDRMEACGDLQRVPPSVCYALGNWGDVGGPLTTRGHGGYLPGYQGFYRYSAERGVGYAILANSSTAFSTLRQVSTAIVRHLLGGVLPPPPPQVPLPAEGLERYVGHYRLASPEVEFLRFHSDVYAGLEIQLGRGALEARFPGGRSAPLIWTGNHRFRFPRDNASSVEFSSGPDGRQELVIQGGTFERESALWATARRWLLESAMLVLAIAAIVPLLMLLAGERQLARLGIWQAVAAFTLFALPFAFNTARNAGVLGERNGATMAVWLLSWIFAIGTYAGFHRAIRSLASPVPRIVRIQAVVSALAAVWIALHLSRYGIIGLKTWRW